VKPQALQQNWRVGEKSVEVCREARRHEEKTQTSRERNTAARTGSEEGMGEAGKRGGQQDQLNKNGNKDEEKDNNEERVAVMLRTQHTTDVN
jgi:hypothetical protein